MTALEAHRAATEAKEAIEAEADKKRRAQVAKVLEERLAGVSIRLTNIEELAKVPTFGEVQWLRSQLQTVIGERDRANLHFSQMKEQGSAAMVAAAETARALANIHPLLERLEWRKRKVDSELECPACLILRSEYGGNHRPSCDLGNALERTRMTDPLRAAIFGVLKPGPTET